MSEAKANVKKVSPYPIPVTIGASGVPVQGKILHLEVKGFIADTAGNILSVGTIHQAQFEMPVLKFVITHSVRVMKTYDRKKEDGHIMHMAEFHFEKLREKEKEQIYTFLRAIRQIDPE